MELKVIDAKGQVSGSLAVSDALFAREYNEALVHQLVTAYLANARSGNRAQKTRAEVNHSTKKPWRQKGTGRARSGMTSAPQSPAWCAAPTTSRTPARLRVPIRHATSCRMAAAGPTTARPSRVYWTSSSTPTPPTATPATT